MWRFIRAMFLLGVMAVVNAAFAGVIAVAIIYQKLPSLGDLEDYRPRLPLRIYTADNVLIGEFGEEKRIYKKYREFPKMMVDALLVTEDSRFFEHYGLDHIGILRAIYGYLEGRREGASTITMQVARNFYLSHKRTLARKIAEMVLAFKIERRFGKKEILERYMNQIYLGFGSFGFAAAARSYYDKDVQDLTIAEIAMLVGLPQAPSRYNPKRNPELAKERQKHVLRRLLQKGLINESLYLELSDDDLPPLSRPQKRYAIDAYYVAEEVRRILFAHFGDTAYQRGFNVYTTIQSRLQTAAVNALRQGLLAHESRRKYRGAEKFIDIRGLDKAAIAKKLDNEPSWGGLQPAVIIAADKKSAKVVAQNGELYQLTGKKSLGAARRYLPGGGKPTLTPGAVVWLAEDGERAHLVAFPGADAAIVALSPEDGLVLAMAGGFDFGKNQFNHVTQAKRQPGSGIKPFVYSAALEKGFMSANILPDTPIFLSAEETGSGKSWQPKNYDGKYSGLISMRTALAKSKNLATVKLLQSIGAQYAQDYLTRFGFNREDHPPYLTLALGAGATTPLEMARGYAVFANGGYLVHPYLIARVEDYDGNEIVRDLDYQRRRQVIDRRNAFMMTSMLQSVIKEGTGVAAKKIGRNDLAGKTGTTNNTRDAWFSGYGGHVVAVAWIGYDQNHSLGKKETGSRAALPIWRDFMKVALQNTPEVEYLTPAGVIAADIDSDGRLAAADSADTRREYFYEEYLPESGESNESGLGDLF